MVKYTKKVIILSPAKSAFMAKKADDLKGMLLLEKTNSVNGSLRMYNLVNIPNTKYVLAIMDSTGNKYKIDVMPQNGVYNFVIDSNLNLSGKLTAVVVSVLDGRVQPLIWGAGDSGVSPEKDYSNLMSQFSKEIKEAENEFASYKKGSENEDYDTDEDIEKMIDKEFKKYPSDDILFKENKLNDKEKIIYSENKGCEQCLYKENFYGVKAAGTSDKKPPVKNLEMGKNKNFFNIVSMQIDTLFEKYPPETTLENLLPESKWVKVDYEGNGDYYAIGLLYQNEKLKYISYAVPCASAAEPPKDLKGLSQWFPVNVDEPQGKGYWIMYQDAESGDCILAPSA